MVWSPHPWAASCGDKQPSTRWRKRGDIFKSPHYAWRPPLVKYCIIDRRRVIMGSTTKFNSRQYFWLYGINKMGVFFFYLVSTVWALLSFLDWIKGVSVITRRVKLKCRQIESESGGVYVTIFTRSQCWYWEIYLVLTITANLLAVCSWGSRGLAGWSGSTRATWEGAVRWSYNWPMRSEREWAWLSSSDSLWVYVHV